MFDPRLTEEYQVAGEPYSKQDASGELAAMNDRSVAVGHRQSDARAQRRAAEAAGQGLYCGGEPGGGCSQHGQGSAITPGFIAGKEAALEKSST
jgi:hypothetical protein